VLLVTEIVFLIVFWSWAVCAAVFLRQTLVRRTLQAEPVTPELFSLPAEPITFPATDGARLAGWAIRSDDPERAWIICCHGLEHSAGSLLEVALGLHMAGFNLLLFDFRGHGASAGRTTSFGWTEQRDLEGALAYLGRLNDVPARPYGVYGVSMGAAVALLVGARDERIGAVVADSPYANLREMLAGYLKARYPYAPRWPVLAYLELTYRLRYGAWPSRVAPERAAREFQERRLLLIGGTEDKRTPSEGLRKIAAAVKGGSAQLWLVPKSGHLESFSANRRRYLERVAGFLDGAVAQV